MSSPRTTHRLPELLCLFVIVLALTAGAPAPAGAGDDPGATTSTTAFDDGDQRMSATFTTASCTWAERTERSSSSSAASFSG